MQQMRCAKGILSRVPKVLPIRLQFRKVEFCVFPRYLQEKALVKNGETFGFLSFYNYFKLIRVTF